MLRDHRWKPLHCFGPISRIAILLLAALASFSPASSQTLTSHPASLDHASLGPVPVTGTVLSSGVFLRSPVRIIVVGRNLVVVDSGSDSLFHVIDLTTGFRRYSGGRRGSAPGDFNGIWSLQPVTPILNGDTAFWAFDLVLRRLSKVRIGPNRGVTTSVSLRGPTTIIDATMLADSTIIGIAFVDSSRVTFFDRAGYPRRSAGTLPFVRPNVPIFVQQHSYQARIVAGPDGGFGLFAFFAGRGDLFSPGGESNKPFDVPFSFEPEYDFERDRLLQKGNTRFAYLGVTTTTSRIFALFSGRVSKGTAGPANSAIFVHVFNWTGAFLGALQLPNDVLSIAVDATGHFLYALQRAPLTAILVFEIPARLRSE